MPVPSFLRPLHSSLTCFLHGYFAVLPSFGNWPWCPHLFGLFSIRAFVVNSCGRVCGTYRLAPLYPSPAGSWLVRGRAARMLGCIGLSAVVFRIVIIIGQTVDVTPATGRCCTMVSRVACTFIELIAVA